MSSNTGKSDLGREFIRSLENGATDALLGDAIETTLWEEAENTSPDPCWTLSEYCQESRGITDVRRFS